MKRDEFEIIKANIEVFVKVQKESDGGWLAMIHLPEIERSGRGSTRKKAVKKVVAASSADRNKMGLDRNFTPIIGDYGRFKQREKSK